MIVKVYGAVEGCQEREDDRGSPRYADTQIPRYVPKEQLFSPRFTVSPIHRFERSFLRRPDPHAFFPRWTLDFALTR